MAPQPPSEKRPSARTLRHQRVTGQIHPLLPPKIFRPEASVSDSFLASKRDKRLMKHSSFVSRINSSSGVSKQRKRTRRPGKKLQTDLEGLADALPDLTEDGSGGGAVDGERAAGVLGKVRHRSLKSKRGALKKKERVVKGEMERFGASMARLTGIQEGEKKGPAATSQQTQQQQTTPANNSTSESVGATAAASSGSSNRWAALRGYISSTMEQNPAFAGKKS